jgi:hypothetical protein
MVRILTGNLDKDGNLTNIKYIDPIVCPNVIFSAQHYREDGSCKCNDPEEKTMKEWGYKWSKVQECWIGSFT